MKYLASTIRLTALLAISAAAITLLFCEEQHRELGTFILCFVLDKLIGLSLTAIACTLYIRWSKTDPVIRRINELCEDY